MSLLLSICVPTYNRAALLQKFIGNIADYVKSSDEVEFVVCDNASADETQALCVAGSEFIRYFRNDVNIGFDGNYVECIRNARGPYVWIIGDDDIIDGNLIDKVIKEIKECSPSMLVINGRNLRVPDGRVKDCHNRELVTDFSEFFGRFGWHFTWISTTILRKENIVFLDRDEMTASKNFVHVSMILKSYAGAGVFAFNPGLEVIASDNVSSYTEHPTTVINIFGKSLCDIVDLYKGRISAESEKSFLMGHFKNIGLFRFGFFGLARRSDFFTRDFFEENKKYIQRVSGHWRAIFFWVPISFCVPSFLFKSAAKFYSFIWHS